jgi:hypothetical protein
MNTFSQVFTKHNSDKIVNGYGPVYDSLFKNIRWQALSLLEIGIGTVRPDAPSNMAWFEGYKPGASLRAFKEYFPNATVCGGDVQEDCMFEEERIRTLQFDSTDRAQCDAALGGLSFDIIVDDGLHTTTAQIQTFRNLWHRVNPGGFYFIEDVWAPLYDEWPTAFADIDAEKWDYKSSAKRYTLIVFSKRGQASAPTRDGKFSRLWSNMPPICE